MNIKITYNWLLDYLDTEADPFEIQKYLSLCGPSVESVEKIHDDFVFDIEITSNRIDTASVFGITQEALAILPQFNKKTFIKFDPLKNFVFQKIKQKAEKKLNIEIKSSNLIYRVSAVVLSGVKIKESPKKLKQRLIDCGVNPINNVVDVSNYIRIALGQPCHIFDYDSIGGAKMIIRKSTKGETLTTLDKEKVVLPGDDIIISDAMGNLIDQPGIMGAFNSSVKADTKNIVLFVPVFNGQMVRRTSMLTGKRSDSASYFEKGLDEERTEAALVYGVSLLKENTKAIVSSRIIDIYENKYKPKKINVTFSEINNLIGQSLDKRNVIEILKRLNFNVTRKKDTLNITIPSYRKNDIFINEDVVEEVARIYGYSKIPSKLQSMEYIEPQKNTEKITEQIQNIKTYLKHMRLNEVINLSMISEKEIKSVDLNLNNFLKLKNPISKDLEYLRIDLLPSLLSNVKSNQGKTNNIKLFEIANVYMDKKSELPDEKLVLGIISDISFFDLKGIIEAIFNNLNITMFRFSTSRNNYFVNNKQAELFVNKNRIGYMGAVKNDILQNFEISKQVYFAQLDVMGLVDNSKILPEYKKPNIYSVIKLDLTLRISNYEEFKNKSFGSSNLLIGMNIIDKYMDNLTIRFLFSSPEKNLTEKEALLELGKIKKVI